MIEQYTFKKLSVFVVLSILAVLSIFILWPIASAIITGLILAYVFYPAYKKVLNFTNNKNLSAIIMILLVLFLIFLPLWFLLPFAVKQIFEIYLYLQKMNIFSFFAKMFPSLTQTEFAGDFAVSFNAFMTNIASRIFSSASSVLLNLPSFLLKTVVVFFVFFFGMRDAELFKDYVKTLSPFAKSTEKDLARKFKDITNSVIYGFIVVGILQGILSGIGLFVFGMPNALLLTMIAIFAAIIPVLGAWAVWLPSSVFLLISGHIFSGVGLFLYGAFFVSWVDNVIRPYIIAKKTKISTAIVLIGMIGGLIVFGILGLIIGPLILSYLLLILDAYRKNKFPSLFS
jgi:predicted PurR-regulated permease PerM